MVTLKDFIDDYKYYIDINEEVVPSSEEETIKSLEKLFKHVLNRGKLERILQRIFKVIDENCINEKIFDCLLEKKLMLVELCNFNLSNRKLISIFETDKKNCELLKRIALNYLSDRYTLNDFSMFLDDYNNLFILHFLLFNIIKEENFSTKIIEKGKYICDYIIDNYTSEKAVYTTACNYKWFFELLKKDKAYVLEEKRQGNYLELLAIFYNPKQNIRINYIQLRKLRINYFVKEEQKIEKLRLRYIKNLITEKI